MINFGDKVPKILVIGDLMIDQYLWGSCERISPEAPVQVINVTNDSKVLGGAGNVVNNLNDHEQHDTPGCANPNNFAKTTAFIDSAASISLVGRKALCKKKLPSRRVPRGGIRWEAGRVPIKGRRSKGRHPLVRGLGKDP